MELPQNCANCAHFDGKEDGFCALPWGEVVINGFIEQAKIVVCARWTKPEPEDDGVSDES